MIVARDWFFLKNNEIINVFENYYYELYHLENKFNLFILQIV